MGTGLRERGRGRTRKAATPAIAIDDQDGLDELGLEVPAVVAPIATEEEAPAAADDFAEFAAEAERMPDAVAKGYIDQVDQEAPPIATPADPDSMAANEALAFIAEYDAAVDRAVRTKWRKDESAAQAKLDKEEHQAAIEALQRLRDHRWKASQDLEQLAIPGVNPIATGRPDPIATASASGDPIATDTAGEDSDPIATGPGAQENPIATGDEDEDEDNAVSGDDVWPPQDAVQEQ